MSILSIVYIRLYIIYSFSSSLSSFSLHPSFVPPCCFSSSLLSTSLPPFSAVSPPSSGFSFFFLSSSSSLSSLCLLPFLLFLFFSHSLPLFSRLLVLFLSLISSLPLPSLLFSFFMFSSSIDRFFLSFWFFFSLSYPAFFFHFRSLLSYFCFCFLVFCFLFLHLPFACDVIAVCSFFFVSSFSPSPCLPPRFLLPSPPFVFPHSSTLPMAVRFLLPLGW